jgi:glycosyltransferase involved in cell wall biosynthesis
MKQALIIFGEDWGRHPSSTQHLALRLSDSFDITYVNSVGLRRPRFGLKDLARLFSKAKSMTVKAQIDAPFPVLTLPAIPFPASRIAFYVNRFLWRKKLAHIKTPLLWASLPTALSAVGTLNEKGVIYYCGDDFGWLAGVDHAPVLKLEAQLASKADVILTASETLTAKFSKAVHLPHGVDYALFATPAVRASDLPAGKPIAGFYGSFSEWIDVDLLVKAAKTLSHWNFVIIGKVEIDVKELFGLSNVFFLGVRDHHVLPSYVQYFDAALLPFKDNEQIRSCNPLKLREYLASGTPVISTPFPALLPYEAHVAIATDDAFIEAIALEKSTKALRQATVRNESWDNRAQTVKHLLESIT